MPSFVRIGGMAKEALRERLAQASIKLNALADELFADGGFQCAEAARTVAVQEVCVGDLGFAEGATFQQLVLAAAGQGLRLCPLEIGPHLRLQFMHQAESPDDAGAVAGRAPPGSITVASEPPGDDRRIPWGFYLRRTSGELWLRGYRSWHGHVWAPGDRFVFVRPTAPLEAEAPGPC